jgi:O-methyltransferase domain
MTYGIVADIGGNQGRTLGALLRANPAMHGILFDLPDVAASAALVLTELGVASRCTVTSGSFFEHVPKGADAYILRQILHDWNDADCMTILRHCRAAIAPEGKLLVVEREVVPVHAAAMPARHIDMEMLVNVGGLERTAAEYSDLFQKAGFALERVVSLGDNGGFAVFEARPV